MVKLIHLTTQGAQEKITHLQSALSVSKGNKTKTRRLYHQICQLRKALADPTHLVNPQAQMRQIQHDKKRRIEKKLTKKHQSLKTLKNAKRHAKRCLSCGSNDHLLSECPQSQGTSFCYKCGSPDHTHTDCGEQTYALAQCFYCAKQGHIARDCELNEKGLYRKGGSCFGCGSVRHTLKDCPTRKTTKKYSNSQDN